MDPNPWLAFGLGVEVGMDSEVSMICTEAYESFCGFEEAMGIFRKESIGMAIPITNISVKLAGKKPEDKWAEN